MAQAAAGSGRPLVVHTMYWRSAAAAALREAGVPVFREVEAGAGGLARLAESVERPPRGVPDLPQPREDAPPARGGYWEARELLAEAGIDFVPARKARTREEVLTAADELGYPVALKALGLLHKSDAGGVVLGIPGPEALSDAFSVLATRLSPEAYSVERTARLSEGVELIVGCRHDLRFGPIALAGLGGLYAELLKDVAVALAPVSEDEGADLLRSLRGAPLLLGTRGRPPVDLSAAARALAALSRL
ncbi:MAG: acetate--CoA ligase family protein, partial [Gaiellaceae bacterium]